MKTRNIRGEVVGAAAHSSKGLDQPDVLGVIFMGPRRPYADRKFDPD